MNEYSKHPVIRVSIPAVARHLSGHFVFGALMRARIFLQGLAYGYYF